MRFAAMDGAHRNVERMRFFDHAVALEMVRLRRERERIVLVAGAAQLHGKIAGALRS